MKTFKNVGERITAKDISIFTGFSRTTSFKHLRAIKLTKLARRAEAIRKNEEANQKPNSKIAQPGVLQPIHVFIGDAAEHFDVEPDLIRTVLNR